MKHLLLTALISFGISNISSAQITITSADMPSTGDTLRSSMASPLSTLDLTTTGANTTWDFSALTPVAQSVDTFVTAVSVNPLYAFSLGLNAYGTRADISALTGGQPLPLPVDDVHLFFEKKSGPSRFVAKGFGVEMNGIGLPMAYNDEDEIMFFPLSFGDSDSSTFALDFNMQGFGGIKMEGTRHTEVDGWGTITTPFFTTAEPCLRVRSVAVEVDSILMDTTAIGIPRTTIEYRWMTNSEKYPALWVTATEVLGMEQVTSVRYRDHYRVISSVGSLSPVVRSLGLHPNPATTGEVVLDIPASWQAYVVEVFDIQGRLMLSSANKAKLDVSALSKGNYIVRAVSGGEIGMAKLVK